MLRFNICIHLRLFWNLCTQKNDSDVNRYQHYNPLALKQLDVCRDNKTNTCIVISKALRR